MSFTIKDLKRVAEKSFSPCVKKVKEKGARRKIRTAFLYRLVKIHAPSSKNKKWTHEVLTPTPLLSYQIVEFLKKGVKGKAVNIRQCDVWKFSNYIRPVGDTNLLLIDHHAFDHFVEWLKDPSQPQLETYERVKAGKPLNIITDGRCLELKQRYWTLQHFLEKNKWKEDQAKKCFEEHEPLISSHGIAYYSMQGKKNKYARIIQRDWIKIVSKKA